MPVNSGTIASQTGASGGLWTHTPVDWRGNETGTAPPGPGGWPASPYVAVPPNGGVPSAVGAAPAITAISVSGITSTGATINFTLAPNSLNQVEYGTTTAYGSVNVQGTGVGAQTKPLSGLTTVTLYHFRIMATANGVTVYSADGTFTTV